jgi:hypothetical protein
MKSEVRTNKTLDKSEVVYYSLLNTPESLSVTEDTS